VQQIITTTTKQQQHTPHTMADPKRAVVESTTKSCEAFVNKLYYNVFDSSREELMRFYQDESIVLWNGNPMKGRREIIEYYKNLPSTEHTIESFDCHPIPASGGVNTMLVSVNGKVSYAHGSSRIFNQTFVLTPALDVDSFCIAYDCMRLTS